MIKQNVININEYTILETKLLPNQSIDNDKTNLLEFRHQRKLNMYHKTPQQPQAKQL